MILLFRSTLITAMSAFILTFCAFSMSASAAPQFGRPPLHVLDDTTPSVSESMMYLTPVASPTGAGVVDLAPIVAVPSSPAPATTQSPGGDPDPNPQVVEAPSYTSISSASTTGATLAVVNTSTNGASRSLCGGCSITVVVGVTVSAVWLVL